MTYSCVDDVQRVSGVGPEFSGRSVTAWVRIHTNIGSCPFSENHAHKRAASRSAW